MEYRRLRYKLDGAEASHMQVARIGRGPLVYVIGLIIIGAVVLKTWGGTAAGDVRAAAAAGPTKQFLQQQPKSTVQGIPLPGMPEYKSYWVGNSTIPGAGLGVFARTNLPAGTLWNPEDAQPENTIAITLRQWQALLGLEQHLHQAGHSNHPFSTLRAFFNEYPYICDDFFITSLTGTTFTNHAPTAPPASSQQQARGLHKKTTTGTARQPPPPPPQKSAGLAAAVSRVRFANSGDVSSEMAAAQGLSEWQLCTLVVTLRDIQAGEELLEDYAAFNTPCTGVLDCPEFMKQQQQQTAGGSSQQPAYQMPHEEWNRAVLVQSLDTYVGNSSSAGGGLGIFAARDLPAGTVWNKEDASYALTITRGQWSTLHRLEASLAAAHASKPLITALFKLMRLHGVYCPLDDRVYLPLGRSLLARQAVTDSHAGGSSNTQGGSSRSSGEGGEQQMQEGQQTAANSAHIADGDAVIAAAAGAAARCTWMQNVADVRKGEELVVGGSPRHECDWPGFQPSLL